MAKILMINGSQRKKTTYHLLKKIGEQFNEHEVEILNVSDYDVKPCVGCENCLRKGTCHIQDDASIILNKMIEADGLIIGSPVHLRQIPGYLKNIFDRGCAWYHRSPVVGKPVLFVTTTQVTGSKASIQYLKDLSVQWGTIDAGNISRTLFTLEKPLLEKDFSKFKKYLNKENLVKYKPSWKQIFEFHTQKVLAEEILPIDLEFWEKQGYLKRPYFFICKINYVKRFVGYLYYKFLKNIISKNKKQNIE
ncbi:MAG: flavodoxin family protein [Bacilli bacterium]|nr:flavodoxin family protein [Bacilli bacterium]